MPSFLQFLAPKCKVSFDTYFRTKSKFLSGCNYPFRPTLHFLGEQWEKLFRQTWPRDVAGISSRPGIPSRQVFSIWEMAVSLCIYFLLLFIMLFLYVFYFVIIICFYLFVFLCFFCFCVIFGVPLCKALASRTTAVPLGRGAKTDVCEVVSSSFSVVYQAVLKL